MPSDISNTDDVIDSRDIIERIQELQDERDAFVMDAADPQGNEWPDNWTDAKEWAEQNPDVAQELAALMDLQDEASGYSDDWEGGSTLIRDSYFEKYAQELANDIGSASNDLPWPQSCIDWEMAARELQQDYTSVDFDGVTYWIR